MSIPEMERLRRPPRYGKTSYQKKKYIHKGIIIMNESIYVTNLWIHLFIKTKEYTEKFINDQPTNISRYFAKSYFR